MGNSEEEFKVYEHFSKYPSFKIDFDYFSI